jgi:superfamily II DNA helicase RecQ
MESKKREQVQKQFRTGKLRVIVATIAFGMGLDKAYVQSHRPPADLPKVQQPVPISLSGCAAAMSVL